MPQARLPDINTAYIKYRNLFWGKLDSMNYTLCTACLFALNGLLPDKYRVRVSTLEYNEKARQNLTVQCTNPNCLKTCDFKSVQIQLILLSAIKATLSGNMYEKIWLCQDCKYENKLSKTEMIRTVLPDPHFLKVVPKPPERKAGLSSRTAFHNTFEIWAVTFLVELEAQMAQFRDDNWQKGAEAYFEIETDPNQPILEQND